MKFGKRVRQLRKRKQLTQQELASLLDVSISYICKVETEKLHFGDYPSEKFIHKLAAELEADEDELLLLADKVPPTIQRRIKEKPEVFRAVATLSNRDLDKLFRQIKGMDIER